MKTMRDVVIDKIFEKMHQNDRIFFLSADMGAPSLDRLRAQFTHRFLNVGIAEQNLVNIATGLALEGFCVYAYAIAPFLAMRAYEQTRTNLSLLSQIRRFNVNLIGVGGGVSYDVSGPTHHCLEDLTLMRTLPHLVVFSPSDWVLAERFVDYSLELNQPKYIRLDGKPLPSIYEENGNIHLEKGFCELKKGKDICIVSTGYMTHKALRIAKALAENHERMGVVDVFLLKPLDETSLKSTLQKYKVVITAEEAFVGKGGLDSLVSCIMEDANCTVKVKRLGFGDEYTFSTGGRDYLYAQHHLSDADFISLIDESKRLL